MKYRARAVIWREGLVVRNWQEMKMFDLASGKKAVFTDGEKCALLLHLNAYQDVVANYVGGSWNGFPTVNDCDWRNVL